MTEPKAPALELRGLTKRFRRNLVLDRVDLTIPTGSVAVLLGQNGVGKSTLIRLAYGRHRPNGGTIRTLGLDPFRQTDALLIRIGIVPDAPDAPGWMRVDDAVRFVAAHHKSWDHDATNRRIDELEIPRRSRIRAMSRGQAQKVMLILALGHDPELVLLDEPFGRLDPLAREEVLRSVIGELRDDGRTILCATHELELASRIADHLTILTGDKVTRSGTLAEVLGDDEPADLPTRLRETLRADLAESRTPQQRETDELAEAEAR